MAGRAVDLLPYAEATASAEAARERWDVEFSRFFNYPRPSSSSPSLFKPLPKSKNRSGTWISAASPAVLRLLKRHAASVPVLSVSVSGRILEEHFVSNLHFSWPQVSCVSQCPIRGSRAVFLSYRDCSGQIQKFAVRFPTGCAAQTFLNSAKECLRDTMDIAAPGCDIVCENSSPSEFITSNGLHYRFDEESSYEEPVATYAPEMPTLTYNNEQPLQPLLANNIETIFSGFPPSFTELLTNCSTDNEKEQSTAREESNPKPQNEGNLLNPSCHDAAELPESTEVVDLKTQIAKYMSDASFHDMLFKIEKVIDELGGDLAL